MATIYLLRHGEFENPSNLYKGRLIGYHLSAEGRENIQHVAELLENSGITNIVSSPLERAVETAEIVSAKLNVPISKDDRLLEYYTPFEGITKDEFHAAIATSSFSVYNHPFHITNGGETLEDIFERMNEVIQEVLVKGENTLIVSHGDPLSILVARLKGQEIKKELPLKEQVKYVPKSGLVKVEFENGKLIGLIELNY